ncbi:signal peptidase II [Chloroflexota bacterium]
MQKVNYLWGNWHNVAFICIAILIVFADQLSKTWIRANLPYGHSLFNVGFFQITHAQNTGAAFGLFQGQSFILTVIAFAGAVAVLLFVFLSRRYLPSLDSMVGKSVLGLVLGGIVGNLIDRLRLGYITDFIDFRFWPAFNIADSAITVSVIIFAYLLIRQTVDEKH